MNKVTAAVGGLLTAALLTGTMFPVAFAESLQIETVESPEEVFVDMSTNQDGEQGNAAFSSVAEDFVWKLSSDGTLTISGHGDMPEDIIYYRPWSSQMNAITAVVIQEGITNIERDAFSSCINLKSVSIPNSVKSIKGDAFYNCSKLESITIPDSVTSIDYSAFYDCTQLAEIHIPKSVTSIGEDAFGGLNTQLSKITVDSENQYFSNDTCGVLYDKDKTRLICAPEKLSGNYTVSANTTVISGSAFEYCYDLKSISLPNGLKTIKERAFMETGLTAITIPNTVTELGNSAFSGNAFTKVTIPASVTNMGYNPFSGCYNLTQISVHPDNPMFMGDSSGALYSKDKSRLIAVPARFSGTFAVADGTKIIGDSAFWNCYFLKKIIFPNSLEALDEYAIVYCDQLTSADIPASVSDIGGSMFVGCVNMSFKVDSSNSWYTSDSSGVLYNKNMTQLLQVPDKITDSYKIPDSVISIGDDAFENCANLRNFRIPDGVVELGSWVFVNCENLKCITIPKSVKTIGWSLFVDCPKLTDVYFTGTKDEWELVKPKYSEIIPDHVTLHYEESAPEIQSGDLNGDGEVADSDAIYLLYHTFFSEDYPLNQPCDFNGDGEVTDSDAVYLLYYTFFPNEYPLK